MQIFSCSRQWQLRRPGRVAGPLPTEAVSHQSRAELEDEKSHNIIMSQFRMIFTIKTKYQSQSLVCERKVKGQLQFKKGA